MAKKNFNMYVEEGPGQEFSDWIESPDNPFNRGTAATGAIIAFQALFRLDPVLAIRLSSPATSVSDAEQMIMDAIPRVKENRLLDSLDPVTRAELIENAQQAAKKHGNSHRKKKNS